MLNLAGAVEEVDLVHINGPKEHRNRRPLYFLEDPGKLTGVPVSELLGGRIRDNVQYSAYLFYKWGRHPGDDADDEYGPALDPDGLVKQAQKIIDEYGFKAIKLKGGVFPPEQEVQAIKKSEKASLRAKPVCMLVASC
ncbi:hypothetical protein VTN31DRAFT_389 [Thermomyces dupontii]|uniref:uncharacterized protein n=1 Tax=Talaromyces thermophilus TaxID=28565 RepID=UPI0037446FDC